MQLYRRRLAYTFLGFLLCVATLDGAGGAATPPSPPQVENAFLLIVFDAESGRLAGFSDLRNGHAFLSGISEGGVWRIDLLDAPSDAEITPSEAREFRWRYPETPANTIELVWEGFTSHSAPEMRVTATVSLSEAESHWRICVENVGDLRMAAIHFPRIVPVAPQDREVLAVPVWMGERTEKARELAGPGRRLDWEYPGILSMQCLAFYQDGGPGLYVWCDDTAALAKEFAAFGEAGGFGFELKQIPENAADRGGDYTSPYAAIVGAFEGDWFTVAERYRAWALEQPWARECRLRTGGTAQWATDTGLWVWNRGRSEGVLDPAAALSARAQLPVSVFWHWWHGCAYDIGFPEYLPPREGVEPFQQALVRAHAAGVHAIVYMNQRLWGMTTASWQADGAERYAVKGPDGKVRPEVYNTFTKAPCASMCMGTPFWRDKYAGLAKDAVALGVDGIYMDQACSSLSCYDPSHGHLLGGGAYWMNGFRLLQADIRERCAPMRQVVLAGEGCGETWLPYLDLMLSLQVSMERYAAPGAWAPIPFFHAVYHGYGIFYGNYSSLTMPPYDEKWPPEFAPKEPLALLDRKYAAQFRLEQARAFVWGQQPTIANFRMEQFETRPEEVAYVLRLANLRRRATKYLLHGTMLRPPDLDVPEATIDLSRLSIYAGQRDALKEYQRAYPAVLGGAWRAADGDVAIALANITEQPQQFILTLERTNYPLPEDCVLCVCDDTGERDVECAPDDPLRVTVALAPAGACVYTFKPKNSAGQR